MGMFSIRVELHYANSSDYVALAGHLRSVGIVDFVVSDDKVAYKLPPAEYSFSGNATIDQVFNTAKLAAQRVGRKFALVVSEVTRRTWCGLEAVRHATA